MKALHRHLFLYPRLISVQLEIPSLLCYQLLVFSAFGYSPLFDHQDLGGLPYSTQTVSDHKCRSSFHEVGQALLNERFAFRIQIGSGLVKNENPGIGQDCPGDSNALSLAT